MKKKISIIKRLDNNNYSLKIDDVFIEKSNIRNLEIDEDDIIITIKLPKDLYTIN